MYKQALSVRLSLIFSKGLIREYLRNIFKNFYACGNEPVKRACLATVTMAEGGLSKGSTTYVTETAFLFRIFIT